MRGGEGGSKKNNRGEKPRDSARRGRKREREGGMDGLGDDGAGMGIGMDGMGRGSDKADMAHTSGLVCLTLSLGGSWFAG